MINTRAPMPGVDPIPPLANDSFEKVRPSGRIGVTLISSTDQEEAMDMER